MSDNLFRTLDRELSVKSLTNDKITNNTIYNSSMNPTKDKNKVKYIDSYQLDFKDFYASGKKNYLNYDLDSQNDLTYGYDTRRHSSAPNTGRNSNITPIRASIDCINGLCKLPSPRSSISSTASSSSPISSIESITNTKSKYVTENPLPVKISTNNRQDMNIIDIINVDSNLKTGKINPDDFNRSAAKISNASTSISSKESDIYWDNTRRKNLDTGVYTENPSKIGGRGFGDITKYDLFLNGIGLSTRQDEPNTKPQNVDNDRIYLPNHNYNYAKFHVSESLDFGADTRYLNKKMIN